MVVEYVTKVENVVPGLISNEAFMLHLPVDGVDFSSDGTRVRLSKGFQATTTLFEYWKFSACDMPKLVWTTIIDWDSNTMKIAPGGICACKLYDPRKVQ